MNAAAPKKRGLFTGSRVMLLLYVAIAAFMFLVFARYNRIQGRSITKLLRIDRLLGRKTRKRKALVWEPNPAFKDMAIITLATGDAAARHAIALIKALRDTETEIPHIVVLVSRGGMGSEDCHNETLRNTRNRHYHCSSLHTEADDIVSQKYLDGFARLGAEVRIIDPIPDTKYTALIPGGRATFWGMSFNKLRIFGYTEFKKILFIDADVMVFRNIDHIILEPDFTAAFTTECCNGGARGKLGGGMWIFEPSAERWNYTLNLINSPCPDSETGTWVHADMDVVNFMFCDIKEGQSFETWPFTRDLRQGVIPGLRYLPQYREISEDSYYKLTGFPTSGLAAPEGILPQFKGKKGIWHMLDTRFDGLVGNCECLPDRDMPDLAFTVHFSCMSVFSKPGHFQSDYDFQYAVYHRGKSCTRHYYMYWYDKYRSVMGPLPGPYWEGPEVPRHNKTHDEFVEAYRAAAEKRKQEEEAAAAAAAAAGN